MRRFVKITIDEPSRDETVEILQGIRPHFEKHFDISIADDALESAVDMSIKYVSGKKLPDKAIDLLDGACAKQKVAEQTNVSVYNIAEQ